MTDEMFSATEETLIDSLKGALSAPGLNQTGVRNLVASLPIERQRAVVEAALIQVSFEQKLRRRYVAETLVSDTKLIEPPKDQILARQLGPASTEGKVDDLLAKLGIPIDQLLTSTTAIDPAIIQQAEIFRQTDQNITAVTTEVLRKQTVEPAFNNLKGLPDEQLQALITETKTFLGLLEQGYREKGSYNPDLPDRLQDMLQTAQMGITANSMVELTEKTGFLLDILTVATAIADNRATHSFDDDSKLQQTIAEYLFLEGRSIELID